MRDLITIAEEKLFFSGTAENIANTPTWWKPLQVHDWRNYIPDEICRMWENLPIEARLVAMIITKTIADREEWE